MDNDIGKLLRKKRKEKKLTLEKVAEYVGVGTSTVAKWERGAIKNMKRDKVNAIASILGIDPLTIVLGVNSSGDIEEITPLEFKTEVINLLNQTTNLSEQEKQMLITNIEFICGEKK